MFYFSHEEINLDQALSIILAVAKIIRTKILAAMSDQMFQQHEISVMHQRG